MSAVIASPLWGCLSEDEANGGAGSADTGGGAMDPLPTGTWEGTWLSRTVSGSMSLEVKTSDGARFSGDFGWSAACADRGTVLGVRTSDDSFVALLMAEGQGADGWDVEATVTDVFDQVDDEPYLARTYEDVVAVIGHFEESTEALSFDFVVAEWGFCVGTAGTAELEYVD